MVCIQVECSMVQLVPVCTVWYKEYLPVLLVHGLLQVTNWAIGVSNSLLDWIFCQTSRTRAKVNVRPVGQQISTACPTSRTWQFTWYLTHFQVC